MDWFYVYIPQIGLDTHTHTNAAHTDTRVYTYSTVCVFPPQKGLFTLPEGPHFIEPVQGSTDGAVEREGPEPHVVYPSITTAMQRHKRSSEALDTPSPCGVKG